MVLPVLVAALGCRAADPDPDALLRRHDLDGAAAAWEARTGTPLDADHPVADILATRAGRDPSVDTADVADALDAVHLLEGLALGLKSVDLPVPSMEALFGAMEAASPPPRLVVVGRAETRLDRDPWLHGGALPWRGGRVVGWAREDLAALGARIDRDPPPRTTSIAFRAGSGAGPTGTLWLVVRRDPGAWWALSASDPEAAGRLIEAAGRRASGRPAGEGTAAPPPAVVDPPVSP